MRLGGHHLIVFFPALSWSAFVNITVDNTDSSIEYTGTWEPPTDHKSTLNYGGNHAYSSDPQASVTWVFTGVAVYYVTPLWPYPVSTEITLDNEIRETVNLTDPNASPTSGGSESSLAAITWWKNGLDNNEHRLLLTMPVGGNSIVVDAFM
ncbi:hypothetical protein R3P38DRAFT_2669221 [Favolaschia claudopus]|uniref:Uncharacterized protein n=1 Tax=Favolaschia claudopus TaxID=2862362 RepID=A0AAV9Z7M9_9AGAR